VSQWSSPNSLWAISKNVIVAEEIALTTVANKSAALIAFLIHDLSCVNDRKNRRVNDAVFGISGVKYGQEDKTLDTVDDSAMAANTINETFTNSTQLLAK
jgi:hypothetical protein